MFDFEICGIGKMRRKLFRKCLGYFPPTFRRQPSYSTNIRYSRHPIDPSLRIAQAFCFFIDVGGHCHSRGQKQEEPQVAAHMQMSTAVHMQLCLCLERETPNVMIKTWRYSIILNHNMIACH